MIPQMEPLISQEDIDAVHDYMRSGGWLTEFTYTRRFEESLAAFVGARYCVAAPSGTLALFLGLVACGVGRDDEVIVPDLTMAATATAVLLAGGRVVFADIEPETLCMDLGGVERLISARTKAIVFVSLNGRSPAGLSEFAARCQARGIRVIEDAAQSLGSHAAGRHLGTIGDCGCFSFSSQKLITTGQGGAVVMADEQLYQTMHLLRDFGREKSGADRYLRVGWNLKFTDLQAVIGLQQVRRLPELIARKRRIYAWYREDLAGLEEVLLPATSAEVTPWFVDVLVAPEARTPLADHLRRAGIGTRAFYPALHGEPAFETAGSFPVAAAVARRGLWLPSSLRLERDDVAHVCHAIREFFG